MNEKKPYKIDVPVLIIFFNRPGCLEQVFNAIKLAMPSKLLLYQDGVRTDNLNDAQQVHVCREIVKNIDWDCEIHHFYQSKNYGCDPSGYIARKWAFSIVDKCIILEDDCVPSQSFFRFCKELLDKYEYDTRINMICGMNHLQTWETPDSYLFSDSGSICGIATWKRVIDKWDPNYKLCDDPYYSLKIKKLLRKAISHDKDLLDYWNWHKSEEIAYHESIGSMFQLGNNMLNIVPAKNLISNVGNTPEGSTHGVEDIKMIPHGIRKLFTLKLNEIEFPLKHPQYVIHDWDYTNQLHRLMGDGRPLIRYWRLVEKSFLILRYQGIKGLVKKIKNRKF